MNIKTMKRAAMALSALLCLTTTGAMAQTTYKVSVKEDTEDASNWQGKAGEGEYQALPLEGVAAGTAVTVKYNGTKKVKSVKAVKKAAAPALNLTSPAVGQVIGDDGKNYAAGSLPGGVTAVAKICYVSGSSGLALALADEGQMNWSTAISTCAAHTPAFTGGTWKLATQDEWNNMITAAGSDTALRDGSNLQSGIYWSSTEKDSYYASSYNFVLGSWNDSEHKEYGEVRVRACLAFYVTPAATVTTAPTAKTGVKAGQNEAIVNAGTAEGGTMMYMVNATQPASTDGFSATVPTAEGLTAGTYYVWYYVKADASHTDSEISATGIAVTIAAAVKTLAEATAGDIGMVVCAAGHLHDAKTAVPSGCTAVGILGKVTETGHGLILALQDATQLSSWYTINDWTSVTTYAGTTLKQLPDDAARGSLTSYNSLGSTTVSNWCVGQKSDYEAIFTNLGSTTGDPKSYDANVNAYITTGVGGTAMSDRYWPATEAGGDYAWRFSDGSWYTLTKNNGGRLRPVLAF